MSKKSFNELLSTQIGNEFAASQQYIAIAVWFDNQDLPQLAAHFYRQAVEERNHAMMLVQYRLDRDLGVEIPGIPAVKNDFGNAIEPIALALAQEKRVTAQIEALSVPRGPTATRSASRPCCGSSRNGSRRSRRCQRC